MQRRRFVGNLVASLAAVGSMPGSALALDEGFRSLKADVKTGSDGPELWARVRREFQLNPGLIHLNTGTLGATPRRIVEAVAASMRELEGDPASNAFGPWISAMEQVRERAAAFLGAGLDEIALTRNTTEGMNAVATGLVLRAGDEILTTNHEHPGGLVGWEYLAGRVGVRIVKIPMPAPVLDTDQILQLLEDHITSNTRVCSLSHVDTITGLRMPLARIADQITRPREILLVCDGAQAPGMLNVDVRALGVDTYASSSHKWLLAPKGCGLLYIRKEVQDRIRPVQLHSGYAAYTASSGTRDAPLILGHGLALAFHEAIGRDRIEARCLALHRFLRRRLADLSFVRCLSPSVEELASGILTIALDRSQSAEVCRRLHDEHGVVLKHVPITEYNAIRISTHLYNTEQEIDRVVELLSRMLA